MKRPSHNGKRPAHLRRPRAATALQRLEAEISLIRIFGEVIAVGSIVANTDFEIHVASVRGESVLGAGDCLVEDEPALGPRGQRSALRRYAVAIPAGLGDESTREFHIAIASAGRVLFATDIEPRAPRLDEIAGPSALPLLKRCFSNPKSGPLGDILAGEIEIMPPEAIGGLEIQEAARSGGAAVVGGWVANIASRTIHVVSGDLQTFCSHADMIFRARPEISRTLRAKHPGDHGHGFMFVLEDADDADTFFFVEQRGGGRSIFYGPLALPKGEDEALAARIASAPFGRAFNTPPEVAQRIYGPLVGAAVRGPRSQVHVLNNKSGAKCKPIYSVIVPFYGDAFFVSAVFHLDRLLDDRFELVIVVDDPTLWSAIWVAFEARCESLRCRVLLVRSAANYGYGVANNLGATAASGEVLLLMNSDIIVRNPAPLIRACDDVRTASRSGSQEIIAGFMLLYEDGTIQHLGVSFVRSQSTHSLFLAEHPMKGLPFVPGDGPDIVETPAVSGALVAISGALFCRLGGFDPAFRRADFEDADLCMRARMLGARTVVYAERGLYHLERQSVGRLGRELHEMLTYLNAIEFNRRWAGALDAPQGVTVRKRADWNETSARPTGQAVMRKVRPA